ncbi:antitoxin Xre/MbcA/ParS toxin-binding domain-containing protein [Halomonas rhizosphaerae]|uniref:antitoxin Xre/MbcA/ParS toxin-binding domain-containing protein n=1 Tax=Halomonas rhizosphaerae TaxID=3043296 RepID=UPI0038991BC1
MINAQDRITLLVEEIFGSREKATRWLRKPRGMLGGVSALEASATPQGYAAAEELLEQLHHGFAS